MAEECRHRNIGYSLGYAIDGRVRDALLLVQEEDWEPAVEPNGARRDNGYVYDLTALARVASVEVGQQAGGIAFWSMEAGTRERGEAGK